MKYYACGEVVPEVEFSTSEEAWDFVTKNEEYDCVVEMLDNHTGDKGLDKIEKF